MSMYRYTNITDIDNSESQSRSRPTITFGESSERSKRQKCELQYKSPSSNELTETTDMRYGKKEIMIQQN